MTTVGRLLWRAAVAGAVLWASLFTTEVARAQSTSAPNQALRVEWEREPVPRGGWAVEGYVFNDSRYRVGGVRLRVEVLDAGGAVVGEGFGWVYGNVPAVLKVNDALPPLEANDRFSVVPVVPPDGL